MDRPSSRACKPDYMLLAFYREAWAGRLARENGWAMGNVPVRRAPTPSERETVETLQELINTSYSDDKHLDLLKQLWHAAGTGHGGCAP